jgi:hypothetical protein
MSTLQSHLICDNSTLANFKQWAQAINVAFSTFGWQQSSDTGQVNWSTISTIPGSGAYVYEIWKPNDGLAAFFLKVEYGNFGAANCPSLRLSISQTTDGVGNLTGQYCLATTNSQTFTPPSTTASYECNFSGAPGRIHIMLWRDGPNNCNQLFSVERSLNASGVYTSAHVTLSTCGHAPNFSSSYFQQSLVFGVGAAQQASNQGNSQGGIPARVMNPGATTGTSAYNGAIGFDTAAPYVGFWDFPLTGVGIAYQPDLVDGVTFTLTLYGNTHTYMPSKNGAFSAVGPVATAAALGMRYD